MQESRGNLGKADDGRAGHNGTTEKAGFDEMGWNNEQY